MALPISEQIRANLITTLAAMNASTGFTYSYDVEARKPTGNAPSDLKIILTIVDIQRTNEDSHGFFHWFLSFAAVCISVQSEAAEATTPTDKRLALIRADVEKAIMADPQRSNLAIDTIPRAASPLPGLGDSTEGIAIEFDVHYRTLETDPTAK